MGTNLMPDANNWHRRQKSPGHLSMITQYQALSLKSHPVMRTKVNGRLIKFLFLASAPGISMAASPSPDCAQLIVDLKGPSSGLLSKSVPLRESFPLAAAREAAGLIRSPWKLSLYKISGGRFFGTELDQFFKHTPFPPFQVATAEIPEKLSEIDLFLKGDGFPVTKLEGKGKVYLWKAVLETIKKELSVDGAVAFSEYAVFGEGEQILFLKTPDALIPVEVKKSGPRLLREEIIKLPDALDLTQEPAIRGFLKTRSIAADYRLRRMIHIANDIRSPRDSLFELEGEVVGRLRGLGARSLHNIQQLLRLSMTRGFAVSSQGEVSFDRQVAEIIGRAYDLAGYSPGTFAGEFQRFGQRQVYHRLMTEYLSKHQKLVGEFRPNPHNLEKCA